MVAAKYNMTLKDFVYNCAIHETNAFFERKRAAEAAAAEEKANDAGTEASSDESVSDSEAASGEVVASTDTDGSNNNGE